MTQRYGSTIVDNAQVYGTGTLGVLGSVIRATTGSGTHGPGLLYNDWDSPADDNKRFRALIVTAPPSGSLFVNEDGSFTLSGAPDGTYSLTYRLFVDGADLGTSTASFSIGNVTTPVSLDLSSTYILLGSAQNDFSPTFSVLNATQQNFGASYVVLSGTSQDHVSSYQINGSVQSSVVSEYHILESAQFDLSSIYGVLTSAQRDFEGQFDVENNGIVVKDFSSNYQLLSIAQSDATFGYQILASVQSDRSAAYQLLTSVERPLIGNYDVLADVAGDLTASWGIAGSVARSFTASYQILSESGGGSIDPAAFWGYMLPNGLSAGQNLADIRDRLMQMPGADDIATAVWSKTLPLP